MTSATRVQSIDSLIGRKVLSRATANELGWIHDLVADPSTGEMIGLSIQRSDESLRLIEYRDIYSFGPDAVMVKNDEAALPAENSPLNAAPLALKDLMEVEVITEGGQQLGQIKRIYIHLAETSLFIYEVRSSLLDKLLGHTLYFSASWGHALAADATRLVVSNDAAEKADSSLDALAERLFGPPKEEDPVVVVRSRG